MGFLYKRLRNWMNGNSFRHLFVPRDLFIERPATYQKVINSIAFEACGACKRLQLTELFPCDTDVKYIMYIHYNSTCSFPTLFAIIDLNSLSHSCQAFATLSLNWFSIRLHCFWHSLEAQIISSNRERTCNWDDNKDIYSITRGKWCTVS